MMALEGGVHPLVEGASALSIALDGKGAFLSGQNGVGKSTFLRTLGLNLAVARAFGWCYARSARLPAVPVIASMQNEDSLLGGQSLYIAELARDAMVVVSSHNLVLGPLLAHRLAPWRVTRGADGMLGLEPGVLGRTNGIALLADHGFGAAVKDKAAQVAAWLASQRHAETGADLLSAHSAHSGSEHKEASPCALTPNLVAGKLLKTGL
jgi:hypothetical protein